MYTAPGCDDSAPEYGGAYGVDVPRDPKHTGRARGWWTLGYKSYASYLSSSHWQTTRQRYRASDLPQDCYCCGEHEVDLHHKTYENIGREPLTDLVPLCRRCHTLVHVLERRGEIGLDLAGLLDEARALVGKSHLTELRKRRAEEDRQHREEIRAVRESLSLNERMVRAVRTARSHRRDVRRQVFMLKIAVEKGRTADYIFNRLLALEMVAYGEKPPRQPPQAEAA